MIYYVLKDEKKYDTIGNENNNGLYRDYIIEIEAPSDNFNNCYISHTETFYRETDNWENARNKKIKEIDKNKYKIVRSDECSCSNYLTFYQQIDFEEKYTKEKI